MESRKEKSEADTGNKLARIATSTIFLIVAFISGNLYLQMMIAVLSKFLGYSVKFKYNHVSTLPTDARYWNTFRVLSIYLTAPAVCLLTAVFLFFIVLHNKNYSTRFRLFTFWLIVCFANIFLSHLLFGPLGLKAEFQMFYLTFAIIGSWFGSSFAVMSVFAGLSIILSVLWGFVLSKELETFSNSPRFSVSVKPKILNAMQLYLVPLLLSSLPLLLLSTFANLLPTIIMMLNLALFSVGIFVRSSTYTAANMRKHSLFGGSIEMDTMRGMSSKSRSHGRESSLNKLPRVSLVACLLLWLFIYFIFK